MRRGLRSSRVEGSRSFEKVILVPRSARSLLIAGVIALLAAIILEATSSVVLHAISSQLDAFSQRALTSAIGVYTGVIRLLWSLSAVLIGGAFIVWAVVQELAPTPETVRARD